MARTHRFDARVQPLQPSQKRLRSKRRQGVAAFEMHEMLGSRRHGLAARCVPAGRRAVKTRDFTVAFIIPPMTFTIKSAADVEGMRIAGRLASEVLDMLTPHVRPGITTDQLDRIAHDHIVNVQGGVPAPLNYAPPGYTPYPKSICTSINHQVCHGIPNDRALKNGDIVNVDVTVIKDGWHGDTSRMFIVGEGSIAAKRLCAITYEAMWKGIVKVKPGARLGDIGHAIQMFAEHQGYSVVREFCGHGIGRQFHEEPQVLHYGRPGTLDELVARHDLHHRADDQCRPARDPRRLGRPTAGPSSRKTARSRRSGSTPCSSPRPATKCSRCRPAARRRRPS